MNTVGRETIGEFKPEILFAGTVHPAELCHVTLVAGSKHRRGEILGVNDDGECDILGTEGFTAAYILAEDTDATAGKVTAEAYRCGPFVRNVLTVKDGYTLTVADEQALRDAGIYLDNAML